MTSAKKRYTAAEKTKIALEAIKGQSTIAQISSKYGVHSTQINNWRNLALNAINNSFDKPTTKSTNDNIELINKLYQQIGQLTTECEWLKKKSELFKH